MRQHRLFGEDKNMNKNYYSWRDIAELTGVSKSKAYELIAVLNKELIEQGYIVPKSGQVPIKYAIRRLGLLLE